MGEPVRPLPPGFESLPIEEQIEYLHALWDHISADAEQVPLPEWHREVVQERLEAHKRNPEDTETWDSVRDRVSDQLRKQQ